MKTLFVPIMVFALYHQATCSGFITKNTYAAERWDNYVECSRSTDGESLYDYSFLALDEKKNVSMASFRGKVLLIVNVATFCKLTKQYPSLNVLKDRFNGKLEIIGFPCNQFWFQEPSDGMYETLNGLRYCRPGHGYQPNFPLASKIEVNGPKEHPIYSFIKRSCRSTRSVFSQKHFLNYDLFKNDDVRWNFEKMLVHPTSGQVYRRYDAYVEPLALIDDVQYLVNQML